MMRPHIKQTLTITLTQDAYGNVSAATDAAAPSIGAPLTPVQALGLQIVSMLRHTDIAVAHGTKYVPALDLLQDLCNPDQFGWAIPSDVRQAINSVLHPSQAHAPLREVPIANGSLA
jgi:hypothetical protein